MAKGWLRESWELDGSSMPNLATSTDSSIYTACLHRKKRRCTLNSSCILREHDLSRWRARVGDAFLHCLHTIPIRADIVPRSWQRFDIHMWNGDPFGPELGPK